MAGTASLGTRNSAGLAAQATALATGVSARWMNGVALSVAAVAIAVLAAAAMAWAMRAPYWTIRGIDINGELQRVNAATLRANTVPRLQGSFFTLQLQQAREVYEAVPWVRGAVVQRVWPNRLKVTLQEHQPAARWLGSDGGERLVNTYGEVFEANLGEDESVEEMPLLSGPDGSSAMVLKMHQALAPIFARLGRRVTELEVSSRGSWSAVLSDEAEVELGRGSPAELLERTQRFVATLSQVTGGYRAPLQSADLRHSGGYAVRLRGLVTIDSAASAGRP